MVTRFHKILGAVLVLQLALALVLHLRGDEHAVASEPALLAGFDASKVTRLQVINDSKSLDLVKKGDSWVIASAWDFPVMKERIDDALAPLARITTGTPIATQAARHKQLLVDDHEFGSKVILTIDGKDTSLFIGGGGKRVAVRRGGDENVYGATGVTMGTFSGHANRWIDERFIPIERDAITAVKITRGGTTIDLAKGNPWTAAVDGAPITETVDATAIDAVLTALGTFTLAEPADPKRDASAPTATVTITTAAAPIVLDLIEADGRVWVRQRGVERAAFVDMPRLDAVLSLTREKLARKDVAPAPTPAP